MADHRHPIITLITLMNLLDNNLALLSVGICQNQNLSGELIKFNSSKIMDTEGILHVLQPCLITFKSWLGHLSMANTPGGISLHLNTVEAIVHLLIIGLIQGTINIGLTLQVLLRLVLHSIIVHLHYLLVQEVVSCLLMGAIIIHLSLHITITNNLHSTQQLEGGILGLDM